MQQARGLKTLAIISVAILWLSDGIAAEQQDVCLKQVFGRYCLGGSVDQALDPGHPPQFEQVDGERRALVFQEGPEQVYVIAFRDRVYKVVRRYRAASQLRFDDLYGLLSKEYGPGEDQSRFPPYASTPSRRLGSIRRGDGRAVHVWAPEDGWRIELAWTREMGLSLTYVATALDAEQEAAVERGF